MNLLRNTKHTMELPDTTTLRAKVLDLADSARDVAEMMRDRAEVARDHAGTAAEVLRDHAGTARERATELRDDAPSAHEVADRARHSRAGETVAAGIGALLPLVPGAMRQISKLSASRKQRSRMARIAPKLVAKHPAFTGVIVIGSAASVAMFLRRRSKLAAIARAEADAAQLGAFDLDQEVSRMDDEGGDPGGHTLPGARLRRIAKDGNSPLSGAR